MRALPYLAFFLSGASSLIFQALWTRMLHHTFGATSVAMSSVLTAFMAGLGLGAHLFGRRVKRIRHPLRLYALCELLVALCALLIPRLVASEGPLAAVNALLRANLGESSFAFMVARFLTVLPLLLVPTTLMGGTLPLLAAHFASDEPSAARASVKVGTLYAVNTFGAVAGSLLGSFVLMPAIGVFATNLVAVAINASLGVFIFVLARSADAPLRAAATAPKPTPRSPAAYLAAVAFGCSGACAMAYEVVWSRALSMAIGSSLQAFALILVTFLVGIAGGSALLSGISGSARATPGTLWLSVCTTVLLSLLALTPTLVLSDLLIGLTLWLMAGGVAIAVAIFAQRAAHIAAQLDPELASTDGRLEVTTARLLLLPVSIALLEAARFALHKGSVAAVSLHGYLPFITCAVVLSLATFLFIVHWLKASPWLLASAVQLFVALATLVSCAFQDEIPYTFARLVSSLKDLSSHVSTVRFFMFFAASLCTLPATLGMGAMFPLTLRLWSLRENEQEHDGADVGQDVGTVYAANTLGSILGAWLPGFVLLPAIGMQKTLSLGIALNGLIALAMLLAARRVAERQHTAEWSLAGLIAALTGLLVWMTALPDTPLAWNLSHMTLGAFRVSLAKDVLDVRSWGKSDLVYYRDGVSTTVSVERWGRHLSLKNNGKVDASNGDDMPTQIMVAAYPLLLHSRGAQGLDVAIVGFGSGVTVGAALQFPVRHIDAMELEKAVVEAGVDFFSEVSHLPRKLADFPYVREPRLTLYNDDGRNFLAATTKRYDVIISEPSNPWITGVADLFTTEHFRVTKKKLKAGGVYCQWVQLYEMSPENIKTIYRTFASHFRHVLAFAAEELSSDTILVGSDSPLPVSVEHVARALKEPSVSRELERAYIHSAEDVWSRVLFASKDEIMAFSQREERLVGGAWQEQMRATGSTPCPAASCRRTPAPLNTDDNMLIELRAPSDLIGFARYEGYLSLFYGRDWPYGKLHGRLAGASSAKARARMTLSLLAHGRKEHARPFASSLITESEPDAVVALRVAQLLLDELPEPAIALEPPLPGPLLDVATRRAFEEAVRRIEQQRTRGEYVAALSIMEALPETLRTLSGPSFRYLHGLLLMRAAHGNRGQLKRAASVLEDLIRKDALYSKLHPELYYFLAKAQDEGASFDKAVRNMRAYALRSLE